LSAMCVDKLLYDTDCDVMVITEHKLSDQTVNFLDSIYINYPLANWKILIQINKHAEKQAWPY